MKHQYIIPYKPFFLSESFAKASTEIALQKACKIIGRRLGTKLYLSILPIDVIKQDGRKLSGLIATFEGRKQIRFNWKTVDTSSTIVGVDIWYDVKRKLFKPEKEIIFENDQNILQIIDAVVQAVENENAVDSVIKIVESEDRLREDAITIDPKTQGKVSQAIKEVISKWSEDMSIDDQKLTNTRFATLFKDYEYWRSEIAPNNTLKVLNYGTFRNYLLAYLEKYNLKNIFMREIITHEGVKERVIVTDEINEKAFNVELYKMSLGDTIELVKNSVRMIMQQLQNALIIGGTAGVGKSRLVKQILNEYKSQKKIKWVSGGVKTTEELYKLFYDHAKGYTIVFDDTDSIFSKGMEDILKAAMAPEPKRVISWYSKNINDESKKYKPEFIFESSIIITTNRSKSRVSSALISRGVYIEMLYDIPEILDNIRLNLDNIMPEFPQVTYEMKLEVLNFIEKAQGSIGNVDYRLFKTALCYRAVEPESPYWKRYVLSLLKVTK
jgi:hypothetical protein